MPIWSSTLEIQPPAAASTATSRTSPTRIEQCLQQRRRIPVVFVTLTAGGLTQASGETATGSQQTTFNAMSQFMGVMTDPFIAGRGDAARRRRRDRLCRRGSAPMPRSAQAERRAGRDVHQGAAAAPLRAALEHLGRGLRRFADHRRQCSARLERQRRSQHLRRGCRRRLSLLAGHASPASRSPAAAPISASPTAAAAAPICSRPARSCVTPSGPPIFSGALAYGWQDITTDRTVTVAGVDQLRAQFNANAWSGPRRRRLSLCRARMAGSASRLMPPAQFTTFDLPAYAEGV